MDILKLRADDYLVGDKAFHIARFMLPSTRPPASHEHDFYEMFLVESGTVHHQVNSESEQLSTGDLVFIRPSDRHALWSARGSQAGVMNLMFRRSTIEQLWARYGDDLGARFFCSPQEQPETLRLDRVFHLNLVDEFNFLISAPPSRMVVDGFLTRFLAGQAMTPIPLPDVPLWLSNGLKRADQPDVLCRGARGLVVACGRSQEHVARMVKQHLGRSTSEIMNAKRMAYAARLLLTTDQPVEAIGLACGFENQGYFFRLFKNHHGTTPYQFRKTRFRNPVVPI